MPMSPPPAAALPAPPTILSRPSEPSRGGFAPMRRPKSETLWFWLMVAPAVVGFLAFNFGPMLQSAYLSFTKYDVISPPQFIGTRNYTYLLQRDPAFWPSVKVTAIYAAVSVPLGLISSLGVALLLNRKVRGQ